jgi:hypothetical protein
MIPQEPVCEASGQTVANRRAALIAGYAGLIIALTMSVGAFIDARNKDARKAAELAALTEEQLAEDSINENLNFGRAIISADGTIIKWNAALQKWTRWKDAVGKPLVTVIPEEMRPAHVAAFNNAIERVSKGEKYKTPAIECQLPRIDDPTKVTHVTIVTNIVKSKIPGRKPFVVAHVFLTKALQKIDASALHGKQDERRN